MLLTQRDIFSPWENVEVWRGSRHIFISYLFFLLYSLNQRIVRAFSIFFPHPPPSSGEVALPKAKTEGVFIRPFFMPNGCAFGTTHRLFPTIIGGFGLCNQAIMNVAGPLPHLFYSLFSILYYLLSKKGVFTRTLLFSLLFLKFHKMITF